MQTSMTPGSMAALFGAMAFLAAVPSVSVLAVSARAASAGIVHGAMVALGIVAADILFILLAMFGLTLLAQATGEGFVWIRYAGGIYLLVLGAGLLRSAGGAANVADASASSRLSSLMTGLLITLGDQKAVLFYLGFLPAFIDLTRATLADAGVVIAITVVAVGGVKLVYAFLAEKGGALIGANAGRAMNIVAGCVMIGVGLFLLARA